MKDIASAYQEHRPYLHFTAGAGWINDPNGLVFDGSYYHLFYQYDPHSILHGPMYWGHARTKDFITWEDLPIALSPDEHGEIFSGSAVIDRENTSGFGKNGTSPMVAVFTHHKEQDGTVVQSQSLAYSLDGGLTFEKYAGNPVVTTGMADFRDPKVFWHAELKKWIMVVIGGRNTMFYTSPDLKNWTHTGTFTTPNPKPAGIWECPDLIRFDTDEGEKWVLMVSINSGSDGDFGMQYFVGDFDGRTFTSETPAEEVLMLDFGYDNYAAVTYNGIGNRTVCIGWMNCWHYGDQIPADTFRGAMTIPRELSLKKTAAGYRLYQSPVRELWNAAVPVDSLPQGPCAVKLTLNGTRNQITLRNNDNHLSIAVDEEKGTVTIDRAGCGHSELGAFFNEPRTGYFQHIQSRELLLLIDTTSVEVFAAGGALVGTVQYFTEKPFSRIEMDRLPETITYYRFNQSS